MKCLIIAAGRGTRLEQAGISKPLIPVLGIPIIERIIRAATVAGIREFYVVSGYNRAELRQFLDRVAGKLQIAITHITNEHWEKGNGLSVLVAQDYIAENFLLMMGDHLVDPSLLENLKKYPLSDGEIALAVDRNLNTPLVDMNDVTKVKTADGKVTAIGKDLKEFNGFDTGVFLCSPVIFDALARSISQDKDDSLSGGIRNLAAEGKVRVYDVEDTFWIDIDDQNGLKKAENALIQQVTGKFNDGPVSRYINRPLSLRLSRRLAKFTISPNQISGLSFLFSMLAAGLFSLGGYMSLLTGGFLAQVASIIDGCDGEIARLKCLESPFGGWFDAVLDRYADAFMLLGLTWHAYLLYSKPAVFLIGFMAIIGSFMVSYTADKYDGRMQHSAKGHIRIGRDIRVFLIFLGSLLNQVFWTLTVVATVMNIETVRRIYVCRTEAGNRPVKK
ncbi:MAG: NTP transferase domain-containing protein [Deltaproteobacteria bacterium]|nr:NTP transferase domain-containing protein [Deltaproteobacteria bacterium]MBW1961151.1 NTP transferase domain-containing protein [Deltaproteobacteria bacterium]MBW1994766.1 NTP transferase domain-containing protein [Deltaproteobacteria bacterium]MBW2150251.1 NTP transferase domain-containing protein [Deltaproteobacteria bacterium]